MIPLNDLSRRSHAEQEELSRIAASVISSGRYIHGPQHDLFEQEFADYLGVGYCAAVGNGTDALELALRSVSVSSGSKVLTVSNAGGYSTIAINRIGAMVTYGDVDESMTLDPKEISSSIDAVIVTHLYGMMANIEEIAERCSYHGIPLIEDCAQSAGASHAGRKAGTWGDVAAFSFYPTKNLGALGDGGAVVTGKSPVDLKVRRLRQYGWTERYTIGIWNGQNSRLDEIQAAFLRRKLATLDAGNERRRKIVASYAAATPDHVGSIRWRNDDSYVAHLAVVVCNWGDTERRNRLMQHMWESGVQTDIHYPIPDHKQPAFRGLYVDTPHADVLSECVLTIPCFPEMTDLEVGAVCRALRDSP